MRIMGMILMGIGLIWCLIAFRMPTTVFIGGEYIGSGELVTYLPRVEVHSLELSDKRHTYLLISAALAVIGSLLLGFGFIPRSSYLPSTATRVCPFCVERVKVEAKLCKHCGKEIPEFKP